MAAPKEFDRSFSQWGGLDLSRSPLVVAPNSFRALTNAEITDYGSLRKAKGAQGIGQPGGFVGIFGHSYFEPTTGETVEELLALNDHLWRLTRASISVTGGANLSYRVRWVPDPNDPQNQCVLRFYLYNLSGAVPYTFGATPYIQFTAFSGSTANGLELDPFTVVDLCQAIDAHASLACVAPAHARVSGAQAGVSTINVDTGHGLSVGDLVSFINHATKALVARRITATTATSISFDSGFGVVSVRDDQIIGAMNGAETPAALALSVALMPPNSGTSINIPYNYFAWIRPGEWTAFAAAPFAGLYARKDSLLFRSPSFLSLNQSCYVATTGASGMTYATHYYHHLMKYDGKRVYRAGVPPFQRPVQYSTAAGSLTGIYRYNFRYAQKDAQGVVRSGIDCRLPMQGNTLFLSYPPAATPVESVSLSSNQVTLSIPAMAFNVPFFQQTPVPQEKWDSLVINGAQAGVTTINVHPNNHFGVGTEVNVRTTGGGVTRTVTAVTTTTITISGAAVTVADNARIYRNIYSMFKLQSATVSGNQTGVSSITITTANPAAFGVGEVMYFLDRSTTTYVERTVTATTPTTISFSAAEGIVNVNDGDIISQNLRIEIWRTRAGGTRFYFLDAVPNPYASETVSYTDNRPDSQLLVEMDIPGVGSEHGLPPKAKFSCVHQGLQVLAGDDDAPNTVSWSTPEDPEYFAFDGSVDIPSTIAGPITAVASDTEDRLAVFKERGHYEVNGDLAALAFSQRAVREGDYGVSSHATLKRIAGAIVGIGPIGVIAISAGEVTTQIGGEIRPIFKDLTGYYLPQATAGNDPITGLYRFYLPTEAFASGSATAPAGGGYGQINAPLSFGINYLQNFRVFEQTYTTGVDPSGGFAYHQSEFFRLSRARIGTSAYSEAVGVVFRQTSLKGSAPSPLIETPTDIAMQNYVENHIAIVWEVITSWFFEGAPSIQKVFPKAVFYLFRPPTAAVIIPLQARTQGVLLQVYRDFDSVAVVAAATLTPTYPSPAGTPPLLVAELLREKVYAVSLELINSRPLDCAEFFGLDVVSALTNRPETPGVPSR